MFQYLGNKFLKLGKVDGKDAILEVEQDLQKNEFTGLYFSASWCGPCRIFTPKLRQCYDIWKQQEDKKVEIVFVSNDKSENEFVQYFYRNQNWLAVPYMDRQRLNTLGQVCRVSGLPSLIILDDKGKIVTKDGKYHVDAYKTSAYEYWQELRDSQ
ncbi:Thioredoxin-like fold [Pseudocohnilembus persalinus]|uniref:Thioredoxin-like fold n=1 Tax=Pseudocohnilembus persalinus TaxID=266149 RepID=A0A0V0QQL6_PSEPJ|nr:Thioredoxin-like fold [Pseudocohnilembus persalinus]|eukprot:KRX04330.1 Thioredoxin-like fold [Pseudocohnilembus persalinus]